MCIFVLTVIILNIPMLSKFTISDGKTKQIVYIDDIDNAKEFVISFKHSVNRTPVNEFIKIQGHKFLVYKTTFYSYGAGMPEYDAKGGQRVSMIDGLIQIENIDLELESITYLVGIYADHTLNHNNNTIKLSDYVKPQNPALFRVDKITLFELITYKSR